MTQEEFYKRYTFSAQDIISNCGGLGSIYKAYDNVLHREVTIKKVRTEGEENCIAFGGAMFWQDFECKANLQDEYELLKHLPQHQNIAYYKELYSFKGFDYAVLPYKIESDLNDLIRRGLTMEQKESIAIQMLDGLSFLHENNIVHGSFDSWSILVIESRNGFIPIMTNIGLKKTIVNVSVEAYAVDEFCNRAFGKESFGVDIEMYGIILYELFTGRPLYKDFEAIKCPVDYDDFVLGGAAKWQWENVRGLLGKIPLPWRMVIEKCIIPENTYEFEKQDLVTAKEVHDIVNNNDKFVDECFDEKRRNLEGKGNDEETVMNDYEDEYIPNISPNDLVFSVNDVSFVMKYIEGDSFINDYYIGETPVTQALWEAVMGDNPSLFKGQDLPVDFGLPNFENDRDFILELNKIVGKCFRLPSEAEWEYAAHGGKKSKGYKYAGGNDLNRVAWYRENSNKRTHPVKQKMPNELGLYDMCGNVLESCKECDKGGCYAFDEIDCLIQSRDDGSVTTMGNWHGLRLALSVEK